MLCLLGTTKTELSTKSQLKLQGEKSIQTKWSRCSILQYAYSRWCPENYIFSWNTIIYLILATCCFEPHFRCISTNFTWKYQSKLAWRKDTKHHNTSTEFKLKDVVIIVKFITTSLQIIWSMRPYIIWSMHSYNCVQFSQAMPL